MTDKLVEITILPTENGSDLYSMNNRGKLKPIYAYNHKDLTRIGWTPQHLYLTIEGEFKEGDWCLCYIEKEYELRQVKSLGKRNIITTIGTSINILDCKKIVASNDESLKLKKHQNGCMLDSCLTSTCNDMCKLPQIPQTFINHYIRVGGVDKVMVEFNDTEWYNEKGGWQPFPDSNTNIRRNMIKVDSNNMVTIKPKEPKRYTASDVQRIVALYDSDVGINLPDREFKNWIKENL